MGDGDDASVRVLPTQEILRSILSDMSDAATVDQETKVTHTDRIVLAKLVVIAFSTCSEKAESDTPDLRQARTREDLSETPPDCCHYSGFHFVKRRNSTQRTSCETFGGKSSDGLKHSPSRSFRTALSRAREKGGCMYKKRLFLRAPVAKAATLLVGREHRGTVWSYKIGAWSRRRSRSTAPATVCDRYGYRGVRQRSRGTSDYCRTKCFPCHVAVKL